MANVIAVHVNKYMHSFVLFVHLLSPNFLVQHYITLCKNRQVMWYKDEETLVWGFQILNNENKNAEFLWWKAFAFNN